MSNNYDLMNNELTKKAKAHLTESFKEFINAYDNDPFKEKNKDFRTFLERFTNMNWTVDDYEQLFNNYRYGIGMYSHSIIPIKGNHEYVEPSDLRLYQDFLTDYLNKINILKYPRSELKKYVKPDKLDEAEEKLIKYRNFLISVAKNNDSDIVFDNYRYFLEDFSDNMPADFFYDNTCFTSNLDLFTQSDIDFFLENCKLKGAIHAELDDLHNFYKSSKLETERKSASELDDEKNKDSDLPGKIVDNKTSTIKPMTVTKITIPDFIEKADVLDNIPGISEELKTELGNYRIELKKYIKMRNRDAATKVIKKINDCLNKSNISEYFDLLTVEGTEPKYSSDKSSSGINVPDDLSNNTADKNYETSDNNGVNNTSNEESTEEKQQDTTKPITEISFNAFMMKPELLKEIPEINESSLNFIRHQRNSIIKKIKAHNYEEAYSDLTLLTLYLEYRDVAKYFNFNAIINNKPAETELESKSDNEKEYQHNDETKRNTDDMINDLFTILDTMKYKYDKLTAILRLGSYIINGNSNALPTENDIIKKYVNSGLREEVLEHCEKNQLEITDFLSGLYDGKTKEDILNEACIATIKKHGLDHCAFALVFLITSGSVNYFTSDSEARFNLKKCRVKQNDAIQIITKSLGISENELLNGEFEDIQSHCYKYANSVLQKYSKRPSAK